ncbi:MAG TPA: hypothetical protein VMU01_08910 [Rhizomicrobium sp.]|nr:hypothetical protein [Rhizomicrobium sp.]
MTKSLLRAAFVVCLPLCAMGIAAVTTPAFAADQPKMSKGALKPIQECKKANEAKDWTTAVAKCKEALQVADRTDYDNYLINRLLGVAYFSLKDHADAKAAFEAVVLNPATPIDDRKYIESPAMQLAVEENDNAGVLQMAPIALQDNPTEPDVLSSIAIAYYSTNDYPNAAAYAQKAIDAALSQGKLAQYGTYQVLTFAYDKLKKLPDEIKAFELMARDYGRPDDWKYLFDFSLDQLPAGSKAQREIAALDIYRLRMLTNAGWTAQNYAEMADVAQAQRAWGDARAALQNGIDKGALPQAKVAATLNTVLANAKKDEQALPQAEKLANNGKEAVSVAEGYYGYGRYADAARAAQKAAGLGGPTLAEAELVLAMAQVRQGDQAAAEKTLASVQGDPALVRAAYLWKLYVDRKDGNPTGQPAAAATH